MTPFDLEATTPSEIKKESLSELAILWRDRHKSVYSFYDLRCRCLCASCVDELTGDRVLDPNRIARDVIPLSIQPVGHYAIQIFWSDGHSTGIYSFEYLRSLCSCDSCRKS